MNPLKTSGIIVPVMALLLGLPLVEGQSKKGRVSIPAMPGMRSTSQVPLSEALEKSKLCQSARMGPEMAISMGGEGAGEYKVYKTAKSVREVIDFYSDFGAKNGMPDATPIVWDNTKGKEEEGQPKDSSGQITLSFHLEKERTMATIVAYRAEKDSATTVYIFQSQEKKN